jgi:hypothetical protein
MVALEARSAVELLPEQRTCLIEFSNDVRDAFPDPAAVATTTRALKAALRAGTPHAWAAVVNTIADLLTLPALDAPAGACRRLTRFVAENADLLRSAR